MRILFFLILQISFWATSFAQKDIVVSADAIADNKFTFGYTIGIGFQGSSTSASFAQGFFVDYKFHKNFQIGSGIEYSIFRGEFNPTVKEIKQSSAGEFISSTEITPSSAKYIDLPLNISFNGFYYKNSTQLTLGISNRILTTTKGSIRHDVPGDLLGTTTFFDSKRLVKIEPYGFRRYHINAHISGSFYANNGIGIKLKISQPITPLAKPPSEIPSGFQLFEFSTDRPGGISLHFMYRFPHIKF